MKNFIALTAAVGLAIPAQSYALVGGPFDHGSPSGLHGGTYEAIYKFKNGNGIVRFSQSEAFLNTYSFSLIFYKGIIYQGNAAGSVNFKEGYATGMSSGTTVGMNAGAADTDELGNQAFTFFANGSARNIGICNSSWFGHTEENGYNVRFWGDGRMNFFGQLNQTVFDNQRSTTNTGNVFDGYQFLNDRLANNSSSVDLDSDTTRTVTSEPVVIEDDEGNAIAVITITDNSSASFDQDGSTQEADRTDVDALTYLQNLSGDSQNEITLGTGGENTDFEDVGHSIDIKVYGSKVSNFVPGATGEVFTPLRTLTGDANAPVEISGEGLDLPDRIDLGDTLEDLQIITP